MNKQNSNNNQIENKYLNKEVKEKYLRKCKNREAVEAMINSYARLIGGQVDEIKKAREEDDFIKMKELVLSLRGLEKRLEKTKYHNDIFKMPREVYEEYNKIVIDEKEKVEDSRGREGENELRRFFQFEHGSVYFKYNSDGDVVSLEDPKINNGFYERLKGDENMVDDYKNIISDACSKNGDNLQESFIIGARQRGRLLSWYLELYLALKNKSMGKEAIFVLKKIKNTVADINNTYGQGRNIINSLVINI